MTINYITYDSWWDTDITILPHLSKIAKLRVFVLDSHQESKYPHKEVPENVYLYVKKQKHRDRNVRSLFTALSFLWRIKQNSNKEDLFFFIPGKNPFFLFLVQYFLPKDRTIICSHNYLEHGDVSKRVSSLMEKLKLNFYNKFNYFHFFSKLQEEYFKKDYLSKKSFYTEMPLKDFGSCPVVKNHDTIKILFFGLVRDYKRLDLVIDAINGIDCSNLKIVVAGAISEDDKIKYQKMIQDERIYEFHFGFVDNADIPKYFIESDFLILPYRSATQSGPSLIAINYGLPIIASDIPTFKNLVIDGKNGFLFKNGDVDSLKMVLGKISQMSKSAIETMKHNQYSFKEEYERKTDVAQCFKVFIQQNLN